MKYIVQTKQVVIQDVEFIVNVPADWEGEPINDAVSFAEESVRDSLIIRQRRELVELYDSADENIVETIVLNVRPATEEEGK